MRVLLLAPPFVPGFMRNARWDVVGISGSDWYPIYLGYCTGLLEREGHNPKLLDAQVDKLTYEQTYQIAKDFSPELTVIYFSNKSLDNDFKVATKIRELTRSRIIFVGPSASIYPEKTLEQAGGSIMIGVGEFDFTVLDLANNVALDQINGLVWADTSGKTHVNPPREPVRAEELDKLPFVTDVYRKHLNIRNYHQTGHQHPFVDLFTGRGCAWGKCTFCLWPNTINKGAGYRTRQMTNVIDELKFIIQKMPYIKEVFIQDDTLSKDRAIALSEAILDANLRICWSCYSRANLDLTTLKLMKRAGCRTMHVGFESSDPQVLKNMKKGVTVDGMEEFAKNANKVGLYIVADFLTGLPGETVDTIKTTAKWAKKLPVQRYTITLPKPYPGTPLYDWLIEHNCLRDGHPNYPKLSPEEIFHLNKWSLKYVYMSPDFLLRMITKPREWGRIARSAMYALPYFLNKESKGSQKLEW
jgi:anaerobic magnesium-protoporphyrin IX monomethyl ester cyclase